ncbi:hypothetical protein CRENBAI_008267 [Crenichthys baileyi]|uniref:Uncharacterized protein n=1 Tax=Crenichthys baileyi TaxID=28760 RepID=A0AAV9RG42_9TELE
MEDFIGRWKEYFEDLLLNPAVMPSLVEAETGDSQMYSFITQPAMNMQLEFVSLNSGLMAPAPTPFNSL